MYSDYRKARVAMEANGDAEISTNTAAAAHTEGDPGVPSLVDVPWLKERVASQGPDFRVVDASWHMPATGRSGRDEHKAEHIPGAVYFDLNDVKDANAKYGDQILPSPELFAEYAGKLGITRDTHVVIYDNNGNLGMFSAPRAWYIFRVFGHTKLSILNGGLPQWKREEGGVDAESPAVEPATYHAEYRDGIVSTYYDIVSNLQDNGFLYVDARPAPRFEGKAPEPLPGIKPGHVREAVSVPFTEMLDKESKTFISPEKVAEVFKARQVELDKPLVFSCGTGLTACFLIFGAYMLGFRDVPLYDGAWTEWFQRSDVADMVGVPQPDPEDDQVEK